MKKFIKIQVQKHGFFLKVLNSIMIKAFLFSNDHRGAGKMNLFYYRGCVNHNVKVPPM